MAKTDSFFIRQRVTTNGTTFAQETIDLGAFVDALGRSILKIHSVSVQWSDENGVIDSLGVTAAPGQALLGWQLTTQSQSAMVFADDRSLISSGKLVLHNSSSTGGITTNQSNVIDLNPEVWKNGYAVAVEAMYLGADASVQPSTGDAVCCVVLECTVETMTKEAAMALALSQQ